DYVSFSSMLVILDPLLVGELDLEALAGVNAPLVFFLALREAVDVLAARPPVAGGGELQRGTAAFQFDNVLDAALAVTALPDDDRAQVVLQGRGDDLAGAGAVAVQQDADGIACPAGKRSGLLGVVDLFLAVAALGANDTFALGQEQVADL